MGVVAGRTRRVEYAGCMPPILRFSIESANNNNPTSAFDYFQIAFGIVDGKRHKDLFSLAASAIAESCERAIQKLGERYPDPNSLFSKEGICDLERIAVSLRKEYGVSIPYLAKKYSTSVDDDLEKLLPDANTLPSKPIPWFSNAYGEAKAIGVKIDRFGMSGKPDPYCYLVSALTILARECQTIAEMLYGKENIRLLSGSVENYQGLPFRQKIITLDKQLGLREKGILPNVSESIMDEMEFVSRGIKKMYYHAIVYALLAVELSKVHWKSQADSQSRFYNLIVERAAGLVQFPQPLIRNL